MTIVIAIQQTLELLFHDIFLDDTEVSRTFSEVSDDILLDNIGKLYYTIIYLKHINFFKHLDPRNVPKLRRDN